MSLIVYLDETGDHSLEVEDPTFPVFAVMLFICEIETYTHSIVPSVYDLKMEYFGHEGVILHSRDIRKAQGDFKFLRDATKREPFYTRINEIMQLDYTLIGCAIRKQKHRERYGTDAENPYDLSLRFALERLIQLLEEREQTQVTIIAESRGKREDDALKLSFLETITKGTNYISADRFKRVEFDLKFLQKSANIIGTQLADLAAYPFARYVIEPNKLNPAYDIVKEHFYTKQGKLLGCKIFP